MSDPAAPLNAAIESGSPAAAAALSALGRRAFFPRDIPFQASQARGKELNGTIGQITNGHGEIIALPSMVASFNGLSTEARNRAMLYSPIEGIQEVREGWRRWQTRFVPDAPDVGLPIVTVGLAHGLSIVADLFGGEGKAVVVPSPFWGNYRQTFGIRTGARIIGAPAFRNRRFNPEAMAEALSDLPAGEPALAILNLPSNPVGYSPTVEERQRIRDSLVAAAGARPLVVVCDDAYAGLVYEDDIPKASMFWELIGQHENLVPIKVDGATKELSFFGGRVGFLTFPFPEGSEVGEALQSKAKGMVRAAVGSPVAASQVVVLESLRRDGLAHEVDSVFRLLKRRYGLLKEALADTDPELLEPLPFNSGCFALVELPDGLEPEKLRKHLLEHHSTGLIAIRPNYMRLAHCSVEDAALPELVRRLERGVRELISSR